MHKYTITCNYIRPRSPGYEASKVFTVPVTAAPVERVFSQASKILYPLRCRTLPKNFETLLFMKMNSHFM